MDTDIDTIFATLVLARWVHFTTVFVLFGTAMFDLVVRPDGPPVCAEDDGDPIPPPALAARLFSAAAACSGVAWLAGIIARTSDGWREGFDLATLHVFLFETPFGAPFAARLVLMALLFGSAMCRLPPKLRMGCNLWICGLLLVSQAWLGHAMAGRTTGLQVLMVITYVTHVVAAATWVGSLPILARTLRLPEGDEATRTILSRYSALATIAVVLVVGSATANTAFHVGPNIGILPATPYGRLLIAKILLVLFMLGFAAWNRRLGRVSVTQTDGRDLQPQTRLRTNVVFEFYLGLAVLVVTALLGMTAPPPQ